MPWPSILARRLGAQRGMATRSVINMGISGNRVLREGAGSSGLARFDRDVLSRPGARWVLLELASRAQVRAIVPDLDLIATLSRSLKVEGLAVFSFEPNLPVPLELRAFALATGVPEDPVTGSAQAAVGDWLAAQNRLAAVGGRYSASQGHAVGRAGEVHVRHAAGRVHIGGRCCALIRGAVEL